MQTGSCALCVLAAESRLSVGSGMGKAPLYPTLAPSGSAGVGSNHCVPQAGGDRSLCHGGETLHGPALLALGWTQSPAVGSPLCGGQQECPHLPHHPNPKALPGPQSFELVGGTGGSPDELQAPRAHPAQLQAVQ